MGRRHRFARHSRLPSGRLGLEPLESRLALAASSFSTVLDASGLAAETVGGEGVPGVWNGRFESAAIYGTTAIPVELLPSDTWSTFSLGEGFFSLSAPLATSTEVYAWAAVTPGILGIEPDRFIGPPPLTAPPAWDDGSEPVDVDPAVTPNDPGYPNQWPLPIIGMTTAWGGSTGSRDVIVAVIDSGIDPAHPDLQANAWINPREIPGNGIDDDSNGFVDDARGWNFLAGTPSVEDGYGHGTHVSGIIGAVGNNGQGIAGVNWQITIMPLKILNDSGVGTIGAAISAINYATMMRRDFEANIVASNNSWGATTGFSQLLLDAIALLGDSGALFVAAAGNNATDNDVSPRFPSSFTLPTVIAVAATTEADTLAAFSNFGATSVDLGAPGGNIYSTFPGGNYGYLSGTSMAAPHVTAAIALLRAARPSLSSVEARAAILGSTDGVPSLAGKTVTGGRLNVDAALRSVGIIPVVPPSPPTPPPPRQNATLPFEDTFNTLDSPFVSGFWTTRLGSLGTQSQQAVSQVAGTSIMTLNGLALADSIVQTFINVRNGTSAGLVARYTGAGDRRMYAATVAFSGSALTSRIWRNTGATWTALATAPVPSSSGVLRFEVIGSSLSLFFNGVRVAAAFDTLIAGAGAIGARAIGRGVSFDNYLAIAPTPPVPTIVTLPFVDNFNRPDTPYVSASWTKRIGSITLASNAVVSRIAGPSVMTLANLAVADVSAQAFVNVGAASAAGLVARYTGPGDANMYVGTLARVAGGYAGRIWRHGAAGWVQLASGAALGGSGTLGFEVVGSSLTLSLNGRQIAAAFDTTITRAGAVGIRFVAAGASADNVVANALVPPLTINGSLPFADDFNRPDDPYVSGLLTKTIGNVAIVGQRVVSRIDGTSILMLNGASIADSRSQIFADVTGGDSVGLVARYGGTGDRRMYAASLARVGSGFAGRLWRNVGGAWTLLASAPVADGSGLLTFDVVGSSLKLSLDGVLLATARDNAIAGPGRAGIRFIGTGAAADDSAIDATAG